MKRFFCLTLIALFAMTASAVDATTQATMPESTSTVAKLPLVKISKREFRQKVWNPKESRKFRYKGTQPIVIDFNAEWCKPCKMIHPILEELHAEYEGKVTFYSIDIDAEASSVPNYPEDFGFDRIPAMVVIKVGQNKKPAVYRIGGLNKDMLRQIIDSELK